MKKSQASVVAQRSLTRFVFKSVSRGDYRQPWQPRSTPWPIEEPTLITLAGAQVLHGVAQGAGAAGTHTGTLIVVS